MATDRITITLDEALIAKLKARAWDEHRTVSNLVSHLVTIAMDDLLRQAGKEG